MLRLYKGLPKDDLVFVILVNPAESTSRAVTQDAFEKDPLLAGKAYKNYLKYAKAYGWKVIDGSKSRDQVHQEILKIVTKTLKL